MDINPAGSDENPVKPVKQIINRFVPEDARLARTTKPGHLQLLGEELGVRHILTRPMTGIQDQHPGIDAMLVPLPGGYSVVINERAPDTRRDYSLAHELAHIMLLQVESSTEDLPNVTRYRSSVSANDKWKAEERLCDAIAAELLMPETMFTAELSKFGRALEHLHRLAKLFGTSLTATAIRYWELLPEPCQLIRWRPPARKKEVIMPTWQMRNKSPGPYICPVTASSINRRNEFCILRATWRTMRTSVSHESLLEKYVNAGRRYIRSATFETESIGFGSPANRTLVSAVYLGRTLESV